MRRVEVTEATGVPMTAQEWEDYVVAHHRPLIEATRRAMERAKMDGGVPLEDILAKYAHELKPAPKRTRRPATRVARRSRAR